MRIKYIVLFFIVLFVSCQEEFSLESGLNEKLLVVNGLISNSPPPYTVKLSRTSDAGNPQYIPETEAQIKIIDQNGNTEKLSEIQPGIYKTSETGMQGETGNSYKLYIKLSNGNEYETGFQTLKNTTNIDSVYYQKEYEKSAEFPNGLPGYQFYVDTKRADNSKNYFLWKMTETYEYNIDYELAYMENIWGNKIYIVPKYDTLKTCWKTSNLNTFTTAATTNLSVPVIIKKKLTFVGTDTKKLTTEYSLLLKQYSIDKSAYDFWKSAEKQLSQENFLIGYQPYNIQGNIRNINDEKEQVFGYFTVASVSEKRIYVNTIPAPFYYQKCLVITDPDKIANFKVTHRAPYFYTYIETDDGQTIAGLLIHASCLDCRAKGGTITKPDFWTYF